MKQLFSRYLLIVALFFLAFSFKTQAQTGPANDSLYIVGSATAGGWSNPIPAANIASQTFTTISPTSYKINVLLVGGSEYKFISQNGSWGSNWGIATKDDPSEINGGPFTSGSQNIMAPALSGTYTINVDFATNFFSIKLFSMPKVIISSFAPTTAATGDTVTIKGSDFIGASAVSFGGTTATYFQLVNDSTIKAVVGSGASGIVQVTATDGVGVLAGFTYNTNTLFIVGSATAGAWANPIPSVDSAAQQFTQISPTEYKITIDLIGNKEYKFIPQDGSWALSYGIAVTDDPAEINGGAFIANGQNILSPAVSGSYIIDVNFATNIFTVTPTVISNINVNSFSPVSADSGATVTIKGNGFTGATSVSFGGTAAASFTVVNDSTITAVVGGGTSGTVQVISPNGTGALAGFTYIVIPKTLFIVGDATSGGWANPIPSADSAAQQFTQISPTEFKITIVLIGGKEYKFFPLDGFWTPSYGIAVVDDPAEINGGAFVPNGQNILSPATSGVYVIDVDFAKNLFTVSSTLPVEIVSFNAVVNNNTVTASWQTATELNIAHFNVQHSKDGSNFAGIGTVKAVGSGSNSYQFTDVQPSTGNNYYRLQIVDNTGTISYSKVATVQFAGSSNRFALYPTLIRNGIINVLINQATAGKATIRVIDLSGRVLQSDAVSILDGSNIISHKISTTTKGSYILSIETSNGKQSFKVIVE